MKTEPNDWANPVPQELIEKERQGHYRNAGEAKPFGLTKREQFSAMAMQGILSTLPVMPLNESNLSKVCAESVLAADELIKALNNEQ